MTISSLLDEVVRDLEQHENSVRIRKLLFCACRNHWENNTEALLNINLKDLVGELLDLNSTIDQLSVSLYGVVTNLNRKTEYSLVANTIINHVGKLYDDLDEATQVVAFKPKTRDSLSKYPVPVKEIAKKLEQHENATRIRKMLFCLCKGQWLNDLNKLLSVSLEELIQETYNLYPTIDELSIALYQIVDSLNRKAEYSLIANIIIGQLGQLYDGSDDSTNLNRQQAGIPSTAVRTLANATPPVRGAIVDRPVEIQDTGSKPTLVESTANASPSPTSKTYDPFAVRLEVMKYSNPLRAKILAFSTLHHLFDGKSEAWSNIRTCEFDRLLLDLYDTCETLPDLESQLYETANHLDRPNESLQAASAIVKAMKPFYGNDLK